MTEIIIGKVDEFLGPQQPPAKRCRVSLQLKTGAKNWMMKKPGMEVSCQSLRYDDSLGVREAK